MKNRCASCGLDFNNNKRHYDAHGNYCFPCEERIKKMVYIKARINSTKSQIDAIPEKLEKLKFNLNMYEDEFETLKKTVPGGYVDFHFNTLD